MRTANYAERDRQGRLGVLGILKKKKSMTLEQFDRYWRDVHGLLAARVPGFHQMWQHHLAPVDQTVFPQIEGIEYSCSEEDQFEGVSEGSFLSSEDLNQLVSSKTSNLLMADEQNVFEHTILYTTSDRNSQTLMDGIEESAPNGDQGFLKFMVFFKKRDTASLNEFWAFMRNSFVPTLTTSNFILKVRLHLLNEYDNVYPPTAVNVKHDQPLNKQYQAAIEIAFNNRSEMSEFFVSQAYSATTAKQPEYIQQLHAFPVRDTYCLVYNNQLTLAGQRTSPVAKLITELGAMNQTQDAIINLFGGQSLN